MAVTDGIERLQLGESLEKIVKNADDNFLSLFDSVDKLDESIKNVVQTSEAMIFKGTLGTGGTVTSLPTTHSAGDTYKVITAGTYAGKNCHVGDLIICVKDSTDTSNIDTHWTVFEGNPDGSVTSSSTSSTNGHVAVFDGTSGKIVKDSGFTIKTSVPENAKFTDSTYDVATTTKDGLMSATDKTKLGNIEAGANKYVLPNAGTTLGGVKSGGDVTIKDGVITVASVGGKTADEIGKVKDVTVNGTSVLGSDGVANIVITVEALKSGYVSVSSSSLVDCVVDSTTYKAIKVVDTDVALEVYNSLGNKILTHTVRKDGYLYICVGTTAIACTLRKVGGNGIGSGGSAKKYMHTMELYLDYTVANKTNKIYLHFIDDRAEPYDGVVGASAFFSSFKNVYGTYKDTSCTGVLFVNDTYHIAFSVSATSDGFSFAVVGLNGDIKGTGIYTPGNGSNKFVVMNDLVSPL